MSVRRTGIAVAAAATLLLAAVGAVVWRSRPSQADLRPIAGQNVLLITIDTLRADALGAYGGPAATPALDRLAADGVRFDFAHAHAVMTLTSHASILTGELPFQHGLRDNSGYRLPADARTAATLLKQAGYATAAFVGAFPVHSRFGLNVGFDVYDDRVGDEAGADRLRHAGAAGVGRRSAGASVGCGGSRAARAVVRVGPRVRSTRAVPAAGAVRRAVRGTAVLRRGGRDRRRAGAAAGRCQGFRPADAGRRDG